MKEQKKSQNRLKQNKGITLIALVITIIVLLILAGVSISAITGNESAMEKAKQAKTASENADELDTIKLAVVEAVGKGYTGYIDNEETLTNALGDLVTSVTTNEDGSFKIIGSQTGNKYIIDKHNNITHIYDRVDAIGKKFNELSIIEDNNKFCVIPSGFTVSGIESETYIDKGLVIYDIPDSENVNSSWWNIKDGDNHLYCQKNFNQFVWIPTNLDNYVRDSFEEDIVFGYYKEPDNYANNSEISDRAKMSALKYEGFYIARYESSFYIDDNDNVFCKSVISHKKNSTEWNRDAENNGALFNFVTWRESMQYSNNMYNGNKDISSVFLLGTQWDAILNWIAETNNYNIIKDSSVGNYSENLINTGTTSNYEVNNIYDLAGNLREWTQEFQSWNMTRIVRGGCYNSDSSASKCMATRNMLVSSTKSSDIGFRVALIIN